jgi:hypothetical protein
LPTEKPGVLTGTTKVERPFGPRSGSVTAMTVDSPCSGVPALVEKIFEPLMTKWSPSSVARVLMVATSEPPPGSVTPNEAIVSPRQSRVSQAC